LRWVLRRSSMAESVDGPDRTVTMRVAIQG
jgi:hypothetical protein